MNILNENRILGENARHKGQCQRWLLLFSPSFPLDAPPTQPLTLNSLATNY